MDLDDEKGYTPTDDEIEQALPSRGLRHFVKLMNAPRREWNTIIENMSPDERNDLYRLMKPHFDDDERFNR